MGRQGGAPGWGPRAPRQLWRSAATVRGARRAALGVRHLALGAWRWALGAWRAAGGVRCACGVRQAGGAPPSSTRGKRTSCQPLVPKFHSKRRRCSASISRRVCATIVEENCETDAFRLSQRSPGTRALKSASMSISAKSVRIRSTTFGWRTLTASGWPRASVARCICAIEPEANGSSSNDAKAASTGLPIAVSTSRRVWDQPCLGACEWSSERTAHSRSGKTSGRVDAHCPHLMKAVPALASAIFTSGNQTRSRKVRQYRATRAVSTVGRKMSRSTMARVNSCHGPGGLLSTRPASSCWPSSSRRGGLLAARRAWLTTERVRRAALTPCSCFFCSCVSCGRGGHSAACTTGRRTNRSLQHAGIPAPPAEQLRSTTPWGGGRGIGGGGNCK